MAEQNDGGPDLPGPKDAEEIARLLDVARQSGQARVAPAAPVIPQEASQDTAARLTIDRIRGVLQPGENQNADRLVGDQEDTIRLRAAARALRAARR